MDDWHITSSGNLFWDLVIVCAYSVCIIRCNNLSVIHWSCHIIPIYIYFSHSIHLWTLKLWLIPLWSTNCPICDRSCTEKCFCDVSPNTRVKMCVQLQILTYTCVYIPLRRRMLRVQVCYLGDLETDWLSPLWASQGWTTEPAEKHHSCLCICRSASMSACCRAHLLSNQHGQATCPHTQTHTHTRTAHKFKCTRTYSEIAPHM